ncbi:MAG: DHH family phosphoesterase [Clostridia bacterium]|nr:DHH family phosphoesterase [Clostridia bacterium]
MRFKSWLYQNPIGFLSAAVFLLVGVGFIFIDKMGAVASFLGFAVVLMLSVIYSAYSISSTKKLVKQINKSLRGEIKNIDSFPLPAVVCNSYGGIVWYNKLFLSDILSDDDSGKFKITDVFKNFSFDDFGEEESVSAQYNDRFYTVFTTKVHDKNTPLIALYFLDDTYFKTIEKEYLITRPYAMHILVDNIDELYRKYSDSKFALITSGIESILEKWLDGHKVIFKKTANGRFLVIGEKRSLDKLCKEKFEVLNDIRAYKYENKEINATLSIGVGTGENVSECENQAKRSLELALGRGGDQCAVFMNEGYTFFGGMANLLNDNSKVSPRQTSANILNEIKKHNKVLIMGHRFSDNDSVGAAVGMEYFCRQNGVNAKVVVDEKKSLAKPLINYLEKNGYDKFIDHDEGKRFCDSKTLVIVVDTHVVSLLESEALYNDGGSKIIIDHHRRTADYIDNATIFYHLPLSSSTCEMVSELLEYSTTQITIPPEIATALLSGIVLDTKDYVLKTSRRTFEAAAYLKQNGANTVEVKKLFAVNQEQINGENEIIKNAVSYRDCMISVADKNIENLRVVTAKAADDMLNISGVKASFVISKIKNDLVNISARSLGEENVQLITEKLGGGGHSTMAACQLEDVSLELALEKLKSAIDEYYEER